jgi:serine/threonine kinase 16
MKKVLIQNTEQLELVREEIRVSSLFSHPNLLPLLDHAIISVKVITWNGCSYLFS